LRSLFPSNSWEKHITSCCCRINFTLRSKLAAERGQHFANLQAKMLRYVIDDEESQKAFGKMPVDLIVVYENDRYEVYLDTGDHSARTVVLKLGESSEWRKNALIETKCSSGVYISGWNPFSEKSSVEKNSLANDLLLKTLLGEDCQSMKIYRGRGASGDEEWFEESFLALGPYLGLARLNSQLGRSEEAKSVC